MPGQRSYDDPCGVARALDVVGERWALLVVRELLLGPRRFTDLARGLAGVSPTVLTQRLHGMEELGLLRRLRLGPPTAAWAYELTDEGRELEPVLVALSRWGSRRALPGAGELSTDALVLALRTTFDPGAVPGLAAVVVLELGDDRVELTVDDATIGASRPGGPHPGLVLRADVATVRGLAFGGRSVADAVGSGALVVDGDAALAQRFFDCFARPSVRAGHR